MKYRSRISILLSILLLSIFLYPFIECADYLAMIISLGLPLILVVVILTTINYLILDNDLIIRVMNFRMVAIDIARIKTIKRSYNPLSSPAASLKRIEIKFYHKGRIVTALISPIREEEFLEKLKEINPQIKINVVQKRNILRFWDWDI